MMMRFGDLRKQDSSGFGNALLGKERVHHPNRAIEAIVLQVLR